MQKLNYKQRVFQRLERFVPENAVHYCFDLWCAHEFQFIIATDRATKLGDYRYLPASNSHTVTVNIGLNKFSFLITYIHEVAHMTATVRYGTRIKAHGEEWKSEFKNLMAPLLSELVFPPEVLKPLKRYMLNPKASSQSDPHLVKALRQHDADAAEQVFLWQIPIGQAFRFQGRVFTKEKKQRTRSLCLELATGRRYLIPEMAPVEQHLAA